MTDAASVPAPRPLWFRIVRVLVIIGSVLFGLVLMLVAFTVGDCSAFGGTCPSEPDPLFEDDVFWTAGIGAALCIAPATFLARPSWRQLGLAALLGAGALVVVGAMARSSTNM